jgi:glycosyltransferase involved in cell wall biosynthesis
MTAPRTRRRVLYFTNATVRAGAEEHLLGLVRCLDRNQFQPMIVCPPVLARLLAPDLPADTELMELELSRCSHLASSTRLLGILRRRRIHILHSHMFQSSVFASPLGRLAGVPAIVETPHVNERWRQGWLKSHFLIDRLVARTVDAFIAVSEANSRYLIEQKGLPSRKVHVIPNGIDLERFHPGHPEPPELRSALGFAADDPVIALFARLDPQKGHAVLLEAMARLRQTVPRVRLVIAGEGVLREKLKQLTASLGLADAVRFVGRQSNVSDWLAMAQVVVLPSFYEGLPLAAMEALAAAKPLVATAVDGTPEVVLDGKTGLTVPPGDPERLSEALLRLLCRPSLARELAHAGREWICEHFTHARQVRSTEQLYCEILQRRPALWRATDAAETSSAHHWGTELP